MSHEYKIIADGKEETVTIVAEGGAYVVTLGEVSHKFDVILDKSPVYSFLVDGHQVLEAEVTFQKDIAHINAGHVPFKAEIFDPRRRIASMAEAAGSSSGKIEAPMPGKVVDVKVKVGDAVTAGQAVIVVEAMKMQNELAAPMDGVVKEIKVANGDTVESGKILAVIGKE